MKYRKKPVIIEAWQWRNSEYQEETPTWINEAISKWPEVGGLVFEPEHSDGPRICIATLEGIMVASPGDYIIQGIEGEIYSCKANIFEATYETAN